MLLLLLPLLQETNLSIKTKALLLNTLQSYAQTLS